MDILVEGLDWAPLWFKVLTYLCISYLSNNIRISEQFHVPSLQNVLSPKTSNKFSWLTGIHWVSLISHLLIKSRLQALSSITHHKLAVASEWPPHCQPRDLVWELTLEDTRTFTHNKELGIWRNMVVMAVCKMKGWQYSTKHNPLE